MAAPVPHARAGVPVAQKTLRGNRCARGARAFEVVASVVQTLRLRGQSLMQHGSGRLALAAVGWACR